MQKSVLRKTRSITNLSRIGEKSVEEAEKVAIGTENLEVESRRRVESRQKKVSRVGEVEKQ